MSQGHRKILFLLSVATLIDTMGFSAIFGYLPKLIQSFGIEVTQVGFYQGAFNAELLTVTCVALGIYTCTLASYDASRTFVVLSLFQVVVFILMSFTQTAAWVAIMFFFLAFTRILRPVIDKLLFGIVSERNQAQYVNYVVSAPYNAALFLGPAIGGTLLFPTEQFPKVFPKTLSLLKKYPIFLANMSFAAMSLVIAMFGLWILKYKRFYPDDKREEENNLLPRKTHLLKSVLANRDIQITIAATMLHSIAHNGYINLFSLWLQTPSNIGGLGYTPAQAGVLNFVAGILVIIFDLLLVGRSINWLGVKRGIQFWTLITIFSISNQVLLSQVGEQTFFTGARGKFKFFGAAVMMCITRLGTTGYKITTYLILYNLIPANFIGEAMSLRTKLAYGCDAIGHLVSGSLFSWSLTNEKSYEETSMMGFPFNHYFTFYVLSAILLISMVLQTRLSIDVEKRNETICNVIDVN